MKRYLSDCDVAQTLRRISITARAAAKVMIGVNIMKGARLRIIPITAMRYRPGLSYLVSNTS